MAIAALMVLMSLYVFQFPKYKTEEVSTAFFGVFYVAVMLSYLYQVRAMEDGKYLVWLIFLSSWGCDTSAYCVGMLIGRHKLAPVLSPKKSIEGAVGGVAGAALLGFLFSTLFGAHMDEIANPQAACTIACAIAAVISQIGDLAASAIKRNHSIKDYGHLLPGHGGILDHFYFLHRPIYPAGNVQKSDFVLQKERYRRLIRPIQNGSGRAPYPGRLERQSQTLEGLQIGLSKGQRSAGTQVQRRSRPLHPAGPGQGILDGKAHIRRPQLRNHRIITVFHQGVNDTLPVNHD